MSADFVIQKDFNLKEFNTMGLSAKAAFFVNANSVSHLKKAIEFANEGELDILTLGGGSNILFKSDFEGLVIYNSLKGKEFISETVLRISGGENWHELVLYCVEKKLYGIENLSLIPGSVGAAPIQNIGAYGVELEEVFVSLEALMIETGELRTFTKEECKFGYRDSIFKKRFKRKSDNSLGNTESFKRKMVNTSYRALSDTLSEKGISDPDISDISSAVNEIRKSKLPDPNEIGNTGSFFKNPVISTEHFNQLKSEYPDIPSYPITERQVKVPAGWLIDKAGWKGKRVGDAGVHEKQALVLVNHGNATGEQIWNLATEIRLSIHKKFDITLTPEVNVIG